MFLLNNGFIKGGYDKTLFVSRIHGDIVTAQVYVDDIIFGSTKDDLAQKFVTTMQSKFEMNLVGELKFFFGF